MKCRVPLRPRYIPDDTSCPGSGKKGTFGVLVIAPGAGVKVLLWVWIRVALDKTHPLIGSFVNCYPRTVKATVFSYDLESCLIHT